MSDGLLLITHHPSLCIQVSGGHSGGVTPVPIPNTAVKPSSADGTWVFPGRVGRRQEIVQGARE